MGQKLNIMCTDSTEHTKNRFKVNQHVTKLRRPPTLYMLPSCCNDAAKHSLSLHKQVGSLT